MSATLDLSKSQVLARLRTFLLAVVAEGVEVLQGNDNRVPMPLGEFVVMGPPRATNMSAPKVSYDAERGEQVITQPMRYSVQLDCYGPGSAATATMISTLLRTEYAVDMLSPVVAPLYASDPQEMPLVNGEQQYEERWMFSAELQYNPSIAVPQQFANALEVGLINVDVAYPPGA